MGIFSGAKKSDRIYLDYAATTPLDGDVFAAMEPYFGFEGGLFGNAGSIHREGQRAYGALEEARGEIASLLQADAHHVIFAGSATEANNLALRGIVRYWKARNPGRSCSIVVSAIEHASVLETARDLEKHEGVQVRLLPVDDSGIAKIGELAGLLDETTLCVSVQAVNNELGTIQPIREIAGLLAAWREKSMSPLYPLLHTDAAQAFAYMDISRPSLGADLVTVSAHKAYGPKGIGILYAREWARYLDPMVTGGSQEYGLRAGTENVPLAIGAAAAFRKAASLRSREEARLRELSLYFYESLRKGVPGTGINGSLGLRSPHILNVRIPGMENAAVALDVRGIAASSSSACSQRFVKPSHVLRAIGVADEESARCVRFSFGRHTTKSEIDEALDRIIIMRGK
jgi:cysteine desulfurase